MTRLTLSFLLISSIACGQVKTNYSDITPKDVIVKHLFDTVNYIDNSLRHSIIEYLKTKKLDPSKYFVDSTTNSQGDTLYIPLWDYDGLKRLKEIEIQNEKSEEKTDLTGNPGNCGTIHYDKKSNKIMGFYLWQ